MALTTSEAAGIACLWIIAAFTGLWYYVFRYKHANDNDEDNVTIGQSSPDGHTTVVVKRKKQTSQNNVSSIDQLLFPEVANPMLSDVEIGNSNNLSSQHPSGGEEEEETIQIIQIEGIVKMGYLRKKSTGGRWLRRCFFIKDGKLFYVHKHTELVGKEVVHARQVSNLVISTVKSVSDIDFQIISPGQRSSSAAGGVYELQGENGFEVTDWLKVIRQQIEGALNQTLPADYDDDYDYILSTDTHMQTHSSSHPHHDGGVGMTTPLSAVTKFVPGRQTLSELRERNPYCADCGAAEPEWASLNLCIMICIDCSGIHRKLGTHISKVRSLSLDKWSYNHIQLLLAVGNDQSNEVWEAQLGGIEGRGFGQGQGQASSQQYRSLEGVLKPSSASSMEERERFIVRKYADKEFVFGQEATPEQKEDYLLRCAYAGDLVGVIRAVAAGALRPLHEYNMTPRPTAFHRATEGNYPLCVELLCQINCVMAMLVDQDGQTPLDLARQQGYAEIEEILVGAMGSSR